MWAASKVNGQRLLNAVGLVLITAFVLSYFDLSLVMADTALAGGDSLTQFGVAIYARDALMSRLQFSGWDFGNLAGYPALHYYFPLPFVMSALLSLVMPITVAVKVVTILSAILLPACVFYLLAQMRLGFPAPILGAALTLPFLFVESQSMWGGNLLSMMAGEFSYSLGLQLTLIYLGSYWRGSASGRRVLINAGLLALAALSHGCALLVAGVVPLFHVFTGKDFRRDALYYLKVNAGAFCLIAPWLLSWVAYGGYTSGASLQWTFESLRELFPVVLLPGYALGAVALLVALLTCLFRARVDRRLLYPWFAVFVSLVLFRAAPFLNVVDIRFIPFIQLFIGLAAAAVVGTILRRIGGRTEMAACLVVASVVWTGSHTQFVQTWAQWNYSGVERKTPWPILRDVTTYLKGGFDDQRIVYENSPAYNAFGTPRIFEMLPYYSGRATLEGAHLQGSINSPFIFFIQSEVSEVASCPFPDYRCAGLDLKRALPRLDLFNVGTLLVRSDRVKQEARSTPGLVFDKSFAPIDIYKVTTTPGYVRPLNCAPVLYTGNQWKPAAYEWLLKYGANSRFVAIGKPGDGDSARFARVSDQFPIGDTCDSAPPACTATSHFDDNHIQIHTDCVGKPLLIKTSYHPRWRAEGAARIYPVTPGFMLIFPDRHDVDLYYRWGSATYAGALLSAAFLLCFLLPSATRASLHRLIAPAPVSGPAASTRRLRWLGAGMAAIAVILLTTNRTASNVLFSQGLAAFQSEDFSRAEVLFRAAADANPRSSAGVQSVLYLGLAYYRTEHWQEAADAFRAVADEFPENPGAPEALYHVGMSYQRAAKTGYQDYFRQTIDRYPNTSWARHARARLAESGAQ